MTVPDPWTQLSPLCLSRRLCKFNYTLLAHNNTMTLTQNQRSSGVECPGPASSFQDDLDLNYLFSAYGPHSDMALVASAILKSLLHLSTSTGSPRAYFQAALCYLVGFGNRKDLGEALNCMTKAASSGCSQARGLLKRTQLLHSIAEPDTSPLNPAGDRGMDDLLEFDVLLDGSCSDGGPDLLDLEKEWLVQAALEGSWVAAEDLNSEDLALHANSMRLNHARLGRTLHLEEETDLVVHNAVIRGDIHTLTCLLESRSDVVDLRNSRGETPVMRALTFGQVEMANMLLEHGAHLGASDEKGVRPLHWVAALNKTGIKAVSDKLRWATHGLASHVPLDYSPHWGARLEPGTPLDWAVDVRNHAAVAFLLALEASPRIETLGRSSALHRAAGRHDHELCRLLLRADPHMPFDSTGKSPLAYALGMEFAVERSLIQIQARGALTRVLDLLCKHYQADPAYVGSLGENALYYSVRQGTSRTTTELVQWLNDNEPDPLNYVTCKTGQNRWSALRRAVYSGNPDVLGSLCDSIPVEKLRLLFTDWSPDGLSIMHELAFCPGNDNVPVQFAAVLQKYRKLSVSSRRRTSSRSRAPSIRQKQQWQLLRTRPRYTRPPLTPFQLAVLCQKIPLAETFVSYGAKPLAGVEKMRFLGFLLRYQMLEAHELSSWLDRVVSDSVPNSLRRFPHPTTIGISIQYLLQNEAQWWDIHRSRGWVSRYMRDPEYDSDAEHDPMISWRPGVFTAARTAGLLGDGDESMRRAVERYGTSGFLDSNQLAFHHRSRHATDFGSFLVCYRPDSGANSKHGHPYLTALELAFTAATDSPYRVTAETVFLQVLEAFQGPLYCNFPYYYYFPAGQSRWRNMSRRETILHQAIQAKRPTIVRALLENGADWQMANVSWQPPLRLATLVSRGEDPEMDYNQGSFLQRLNPPSLPPSASLDANQPDMGPERDASREIVVILETHAVQDAGQKDTSFGTLSRALREVRWPWSEYATDDLGLRFILFYAAGTIILVYLVSSFLYIVRISLPRAVRRFGEVVASVPEVVGPVADCFMEASTNGTDPRVACTDIRVSPMNRMATGLYPPVGHWPNFTVAMIEEWDLCFNGEVPRWVHNKTALKEIEKGTAYIPGCLPEFMDVLDNQRADIPFFRHLREYVEETCRCECTWGGQPVRTVKDP